MGLLSAGSRSGETCFWVIEVTSFSVRESVRRECGVDIVFARRDIVLRAVVIKQPPVKRSVR